MLHRIVLIIPFYWYGHKDFPGGKLVMLRDKYSIIIEHFAAINICRCNT